MLGFVSTLRTRRLESAVALALLMMVGLWALTVSAPAAHASGCTDSWTNSKGGSWFEGGNWSKGAPPTSSEEACVTESGTYTVEMTQTSTSGTVSVKSLTIGGLSGKQTLVVGSSCSTHAFLSTTSGIGNGANGAVVLTNGDGCGDNVTIEGPISNSGSILIEKKHGGERTLAGSLTNTGTLMVKANTAFSGKAAALVNEGTIEVAEARQLSASNETSVTNATGGKIVTPNEGGLEGGVEGDLFMGSGTSFTQGAGSETGIKPVIVDDASLHYTGSGSSVIALHGTSALSGAMVAGQSLSIESTCGEHVFAKAASGFSSAGAIVLTNGDGCGNDAALESSGTITNTGTISIEPVHGGLRTIASNLVNKGTIAINTSTSYSGALTNEGAIDLAEGAQLSVSGTSSISNGTGGNITGTGSGDVLMGSGTSFTQGAGTTSGTQPVIVDDASLDYTGSGSGLIRLHGTSALSGAMVAGQSLSIESTCGEHAVVTAASGFSSAGAIVLTNGDGCGNNATLESSGTITNTGTITTEPGKGGARTLSGGLTNKGTIAINVNTGYSGTLANNGAIDLAEGTQLTVSSGSATNGAGGKIVGSGSGDLLMGSGTTFTQGAGTTTGAQPVIMDDGTLTYTSGGGASSIALRGSSALSGNLASGQSLTIQSTCSEHAVVTAASSFTNGGVITLTNGDGCGNNETLAVSSGTLTNHNKIVTEPAHGGARTLQGSITNTGTISINASTTDPTSAAVIQNEGKINIANGVSLSLPSSPSVTNGTGGEVFGAGTGALVQTGGTFVEGKGTTVGGEPVVLDDLTLRYSSNGASTISLRGASTLLGEINSVQTLSIASTCSEHAKATTAGSLTNFGTINLTNGDGCGNNAVLSLASGTLTNHGTVAALNPHGGLREIEGNVINDKVVSVGAGATLKVAGTYTQSSAGTYRPSIASASNYGVLSVAGAATIEGGTLAVVRIGSFTPPLGQTFTVLSGSSLTGTFANETGDQISFTGLYYKPTYSSTGVTLLVAQVTLALSTNSGAPGSVVTISGSGYLPGDKITPTFVDHGKAKTTYPSTIANSSGEFSEEITIPAGAAVGVGTIGVTSADTAVSISKTFSVT